MAAPSVEQAFGSVVRELRESKGLSQEELSFACSRHRTYISLIERGRNSPSIRTLWMLAGALEVAPSQLIAMVEAKLRKPTRR